MITFLKKTLKHKTFKNISYLVLGNVIGRILAMIGVFYIPKLLGAENYGIYNTVTAYVALFAVCTFEGLNKVIIRESAKDLNKAKIILESTIGMRLIFSITASLISIAVVYFIDYEKGVKLFICIYSISLFITGVRSSLNTIYQSHESMKTLAFIAVAKPFFRVPLAIYFLKQGYGILSLILIDLTIDTMVVIFLYHQSRKLIIFNIFSKIKLKKEYMMPGIRFSLLGFMNTLSCRIDIVMLSLLTTQSNVGIYALAYRIVDVGLVLRQPISQSIFPYYSKRFKDTNAKVIDLFKHTLLITIPLLLTIIPGSMIINHIIPIIFGHEFSEAANIFSVLVFYLVFYFALIPWSLYLETTNNEGTLIFHCTLAALLNILLNIVFFERFGIIGVAYSTLAVELIRLIIVIFSSIKSIKYNSNRKKLIL